MSERNSFNRGRQTVAAGLLAGIFLIAIFETAFGSSAFSFAYGDQMMDKGNNMSMSHDAMNNGMMMHSMQGHHILKGEISNVQLSSAGQPAWIQSGIWVLRVDLQNSSSSMTIQSAQFIARFMMIKTDGTAPHTHMIYAFKPGGLSTEQNGTVYVLNGTATVTMPSGPVQDVPITIKAFNTRVIGLWIGPDKVNGHFGTNPIYGLISIPGSNAMMGMKDMMNEHPMTGSMEGGNAMHMMLTQNLTMTNLPVKIPLTRGYENGHEIFYISTEASDKGLASLMTNWTGARVAYAPALARTPPSAFANLYAFKNGVVGSGPLGFQPNVADSQPGDPGYSPLWRVVLVEWKQGANATELKSEQEISAAASQGLVTITPTNNMVNCPVIKWDGGSLMERADKNLTDMSPYGPGQVLDINMTSMKVTFVAHRGFAPDGSTIYYIATDASNPDAAKALGVLYVNKTGATTLTGAASDLYVFTNGIKGTGPMGYQASIASSNIGDQQYSPMWRINAVAWHDQSMAKFLTMSSQISMDASSNLLTTQVAGFVVNCPFVQLS